MNRQELIQAAKENLATWEFTPSEVREVMKKAGKNNCLYLNWQGEWVNPHSTNFVSGNRYRLRPDYEEPQSKLVRVEIGDDMGTLSGNVPGHGTVLWNVHSMAKFSSFAGFEFAEQEGELYQDAHGFADSDGHVGAGANVKQVESGEAVPVTAKWAVFVREVE